MLIDQARVKAFLPHRNPFLFVDSVESITLKNELPLENAVEDDDIIDATVVAHFHVREDLSLFEGHFPKNPVFPGVIQIELMAQASSFILTKRLKDPFSGKASMALLNVTEAKFRRPVQPGMDLVIKGRCIQSQGSLTVFEAQVFNNSKIVSEATFTIYLSEK